MNFLLLSLPRSGSALLCSLLDSHPDITCPHECIRYDYLKELDALSGRVCIGHAQYRRITDEVLKSDIPKIFLKRDDYAAGAVSEIALGHKWAQGLHVINPELVQRVAKDRQEKTERLLPYADFVVTYEDITHGEDINSVRLDDICQFVGVSPLELKTMTNKKTFIPGVAHA